MKRIWVAVALGCLSAVGMAQSEQSQGKAPVQGQGADQTAGKRVHSTVKMVNDGGSNKAAPTVEKGKTGSDDWQAASAKSSKPSTGKGSTAGSAGDVNGDGVADATAKSSGQTSGKRQHQPAAAAKGSDPKSAQK